MPISILLTLQTGRTIVQLNKCTRPCDLNEKKQGDKGRRGSYDKTKIFPR